MLGLSKMADAPRRPWSEEEAQWLQENWGSKPIPAIAGILGRSPTAVANKAQRLGLYGQLACGDLMSLAAATELLGLKNTKALLHWIEKYAFPATKKYIRPKRGPRTQSQCHYVVRMDRFLRWLEEHQELWDSRCIPLFGLGVEYPWLQEKRKKDLHRAPIYRMWEDVEISYLRMQLARGISYAAIGKELGRSKKSIKCKARQLGLSNRQQYQQRSCG